jgi:hypothetical protein
MGLAQTVEQALKTASKLKTSGGNEANTKALLIEPMLSALGWDTTDVDQVEREYRVYDNTALDYALRIDDELRLFVEAKAVAKQLEDKSFIYGQLREQRGCRVVRPDERSFLPRLQDQRASRHGGKAPFRSRHHGGLDERGCSSSSVARPRCGL